MTKEEVKKQTEEIKKGFREELRIKENGNTKVYYYYYAYPFSENWELSSYFTKLVRASSDREATIKDGAKASPVMSGII